MRQHSLQYVNPSLILCSILKEAQHPNVIGVFGACTSKGGPIYIVMEYAEHGSLKDFLRQKRSVIQQQQDR